MKTQIILTLLVTGFINSQVIAQENTEQEVIIESVEWNDFDPVTPKNTFDTTFYSDGRSLVSTRKKGVYGAINIAMWNNYGDQILVNGEGDYYFTSKNYYLNCYDSTVYEIRDSLKNGSVEIWRKLEGDSAFYLYNSAVMKENRSIGFSLFYYPSGKIKQIQNPMHGNSQHYFKNGSLKSYCSKVNYSWEGVTKYWDETGVLIKEVTYRDNKKIGTYREYHDNGRTKIDGQYALGLGRVTYENIDEYGDAIYVDAKEETGVKDGIWKTYDESGNLQTITTYVKGTRVGAYKEYHANAKVKMDGEYVAATISVQIDETNDEGVNENEINQIESDVRDGIWNYYNVNGILISRKIYEKGTLIREDDFDMN